MTTLEDVLASHQWDGRGCRCNCWPPVSSIKDSASLDAFSHPRRVDHDTHVADKIRAHLLSDEVIEAAAEAICPSAGDPHLTGQGGMRAQARRDFARVNASAALTAALDQGADQ